MSNPTIYLYVYFHIVCLYHTIILNWILIVFTQVAVYSTKVSSLRFTYVEAHIVILHCLNYVMAVFRHFQLYFRYIVGKDLVGVRYITNWLMKLPTFGRLLEASTFKVGTFVLVFGCEFTLAMLGFPSGVNDLYALGY